MADIAPLMKEKIFRSTMGLKYTFKWAEDRHNFQRGFGKDLLNYYKFVCSQKYPHNVFGDENIARCSSFKIKYLQRNARKDISLFLLKLGVVKKLSLDDIEALNNGENNPNNARGLKELKELPEAIINLPKMANIWHSIFTETMDGTIGHDPIMDKIIKLNPHVLAVEVPVWTTTLESLKTNQLPRSTFMCNAREIVTGHIDVLLYDEKQDILIVGDYKPEGKFLWSLPQVCSYGLIMKRILKIDNVMCVSFSRNEAWYYSPEIVVDHVERYVRRYGNPDLFWRWFIRGLL